VFVFFYTPDLAFGAVCRKKENAKDGACCVAQAMAYSHRRVIVHVVEGKDISAPGSSSPVDLFVVLQAVPGKITPTSTTNHQPTKLKTKVVKKSTVRQAHAHHHVHFSDFSPPSTEKNTTTHARVCCCCRSLQNPLFNQWFSIDLPDHHALISFELYHSALITDKLLASASVPIGDLQDVREAQVPLLRAGVACGELSCRFVPLKDSESAAEVLERFTGVSSAAAAPAAQPSSSLQVAPPSPTPTEREKAQPRRGITTGALVSPPLPRPDRSASPTPVVSVTITAATPTTPEGPKPLAALQKIFRWSGAEGQGGTAPPSPTPTPRRGSEPVKPNLSVAEHAVGLMPAPEAVVQPPMSPKPALPSFASIRRKRKERDQKRRSGKTKDLLKTKGLIDAFFVIGPGDMMADLDEHIAKQADVPDLTKPGPAVIDPVAVSYTGELIDSFPWLDQDELSPSIWLFCMPEGLHLHRGRKPDPTIFPFVLTAANGTRKYVTCLTVYEELDPTIAKDLLDRAKEFASSAQPQTQP
jgi:hypothetical protein